MELRSYVKRTGYEDVGSLHLAQDRDQVQAVMNTAMKLQDP